MALLVFAALIGILPAAIAHRKGRSFAAWWLYGSALFIFALPHALTLQPQEVALEQRALQSGEKKKCPFCAELIRVEARVCRFCGRELGTGTIPSMLAVTLTSGRVFHARTMTRSSPGILKYISQAGEIEYELDKAIATILDDKGQDVTKTFLDQKA